MISTSLRGSLKGSTKKKHGFYPHFVDERFIPYMYFQFFSSVLDSSRLNTTKYGIKKAKIPLKGPQNARKTLFILPPPTLIHISTFYNIIIK